MTERRCVAVVSTSGHRPPRRPGAGFRIVFAAIGLVAGAALVLTTLVMFARPLDAHAPHDQVSSIAIPADFDESGVALSIIRGRVMRSEDHGVTWSEVVRGLGGEADTVRSVAFSPLDPDIAYVVTEKGVVVRTTDAGVSFEHRGAPDQGPVRGVVVSPRSSDVLLAFEPIVGSIFRSADGAASWAHVNADHPLGLRGRALSFFPGSPEAIAVDVHGQVLHSSDDGATWAVRSEIEGATAATDVIVVEEGDASTVVFVATDSGQLFRSEDDAVTFELVGSGLADEPLRSVSASPSFARDGVVWVASQTAGAFRSDDRGATFTLVDDGLTRSVQASNVGAADFADIATAPGDMGVVFLGGFDGLFRHDDTIDGWEPVETLARYVAGLAVSPAYAEDETVIVMTYVGGARISTDGGDTWEIENEGLTVDGLAEGNLFVPLRRLHGVHFSPGFAQDDTIYSANWVRLIKSTDRGESWIEIPVGEPPEGSPLRQFVLAVSPDHETDDTIYAATRQGEFFRSTERGEPDTWELLHTFDGRVRSIAVSPSIAEDGTIFVGTVSGIHRSTDGGTTWTDTGVRNAAEVTGREVDFATQVAVSPDFGVDGTALAATDHALYRTTDRGVTWTRLSGPPLPEPGLVEAVAFSPEFADDGLVLASIRGVGLVRSTDGGESFEVVGEDLLRDNLVIADYANPSSSAIQFSPTYGRDGTVFAFAQQEVIKSTDAGETWEVLALPSTGELLASLEGTAVGDDDPSTTTLPPSADEETADDDSASPSATDTAGTGNRPLWAIAVVAAVVVVAGGVVAFARRASRT